MTVVGVPLRASTRRARLDFSIFDLSVVLVTVETDTQPGVHPCRHQDFDERLDALGARVATVVARALPP